MINHILFFFKDYLEFAMREINKRELYEWFLFIFPFFVFGETPRYILPAVVTGVLHALGFPRTRTARTKAFLDGEPTVSIVVAAHNEEDAIVGNIASLVEMPYPHKEIIVVDDHSTDRTHELAKPFADRGQIRLLRNDSPSGRGGRPFATNLGAQASIGEFIISVDADTTFDLSSIRWMLAPFANPKVGAVSGNLKVANRDANVVTACQSCEYLQSITLWKTWSSMIGTLLQASGAFGAYRRSALERVGFWDPELAEDADLSSKVRKAGYEICFARDAVAFTHVPDNLRALTLQRQRWSQGFIRTYFRKHRDAMSVRRHGWANFLELLQEFILQVLMPFGYLIYLALMLVFYPTYLPFILVLVYVIYVLTNVLLLGIAVAISERRSEEWGLLWYSIVMPLYKSYFRWVRVTSYVREFFRVRYTDPYLPDTVWNQVPRW
jgi:cellulose synthase/poly-beta-1,6-N-acetylglucosamine synthase-like glycosyltransferase